MESKEEREKYMQLNAEFQKIARRDKKALFNEQCLIIEENNQRGKTRDLFRKIGNIKGAFCPKVGTIKDKNCRDLVDSEGFPGGSDGKESTCNVETWVLSLGWEDPLEKGMATQSCILAWRIPWTV